jgi:hypothetical protein
MLLLQMSDFREQLLACSGVEAGRVVEFSCGKPTVWWVDGAKVEDTTSLVP